MSITGVYDSSSGASRAQPWLRSARWDLTFLIGSVALAFVPYSVYAVLGGDALEAASTRGTAAYNARTLVNTLVALLVGGPHMYATFTRTVADRAFLRRRLPVLAASALVPVVVIAMTVLSYTTYVWLLSVFFAVASIHALHQVVWLTEAYNRKAGLAESWPSRLIDYGVVLVSLYPIAMYKMVRGQFRIGPVELKYGELVAGWYWLPALVGAAFAVLLVLFAAKTYREHRAGNLNVPKTLLIVCTVTLTFWAPLSPNLDTAFQGVNAWHSFQYLALTWYANRVRERAGGKPLAALHWLTGGDPTQPGFARRAGGGIRGLIRQLDGDSGWVSFYGICLAMLPISGLLIVAGSILWPNLHNGQPGADEAYSYMGILSILLVHYVQDALLFGDPDAIVAEP